MRSVTSTRTFLHFIVIATLLIAVEFVEGQMKIHPYFTELFDKDARSMNDAQAYKILKKYPLAKDVNYLAVPWVYLILKSQADMVPDITLDGGFTLCQEHYETILPRLKQIGIEVVFSPHAKKGMEYEGIKVLPFPFYAINGVGPAEKKDILYSFVGFISKKRRYMLKLQRRKDVVIVFRKNWHFALDSFKPNCETKKQQEKEREEYQDILSRSRYSLCPRGTNPATIRFWESLQAGAIPVLIGNDMWLPEGFDWHSCVVRVSENAVDKIDQIIRKIPVRQEQYMRARCLEAYKLFSGKNFVSVIRHYYENMT